MSSLSCCSRRGCRALLTAFAGAVVALLFVLAPPSGVSAAFAATLTTPYPSMTVQAGQTVSVNLSLKDTVAGRMDVSVQGTPSGWKATLLGGGRPVSAVMVDPDSASNLSLQVEVPFDAAGTTTTLTVVARSGATSVTLPISLTVSESEGGTTELSAEYSSLKGSSDATFTFSLTLTNSTLDARTYNLTASGPENWTLTLTPSGSSQQTPTVGVESQSSQGLTLKVTPAPNAEIGTYDLSVTATGGGEAVSVPLQVEITGSYKMTLTTPDGNLNANVKAGSTTQVQFVVVNTGTGPLQDVQLSASPPTNWKVTFEPTSIASIPASQQAQVTAIFTPAENAIAGDYVVTMRAASDQASSSSDIRVTVKTSTLWGVIGVLIAVAAIAILGFVFRRYGHR